MSDFFAKRIFSPGLIDLGLLIIRLWFGGVMVYHGKGKVFGDFDKFTAGVSEMGMPAFLAWPAALAEFAGGILVMLGFFTPLALIFIAATMAVAGFIKHAPDPFGKKELALTYFFLAIGLLMTGPGRYSVDAWLLRRRSDEATKKNLYI